MYRLDTESARSSQQRALMVKFYRILVTCMVVVFAVAILSLALGGLSLASTHSTLYVGLLIGLGAASLTLVVALPVWLRRSMKRIGQREITAGSPTPLPVPLFEYRSKLALFGLPLVHIRLRGGLERGPVKAWIAAGDAAIGVIFAFGAVAIAPISLGAFAAGLLTVGGCAVGLVPFGGLSFGVWAVGAFAVGWKAFGACAIAWQAADGGVALARAFALGSVALAQHANDPAAEAFIRDTPFFQNALAALRYAPWLNLVLLLPPALWWRQRKNKRQQLNPRN
jgi:hypothetical protein